MQRLPSSHGLEVRFLKEEKQADGPAYSRKAFKFWPHSGPAAHDGGFCGNGRPDPCSDPIISSSPPRHIATSDESLLVFKPPQKSLPFLTLVASL